MEKQLRVKRTYAMLKEATNGEFPANRAALPEDDNGFFSTIAEGKQKLSRAAYGLLSASIIHTVINIIIYDSCPNCIAIFVVIFEIKQKCQNL